MQNAIKPLPKDGIIIRGTNEAIPEGWSEAAEYWGVFLIGYGSITHTQNNGATIGNSATTHSSGAVQGDALRNLEGHFRVVKMNNNRNSQNEIRPVNKAVKFIKYTNAAVLPNIPDIPQSKVYYAFYLKIQK